MCSIKQRSSSKSFIQVMVGLLICAILPGACSAAGLLKPVNNQSQNDVYIKSHKVNVVINNGFARTEVDQVFGNRSERDLEATYSFPVPKQASLSELSLWIDGQEVIGEVLEKERAKKAYQEQKAKGNDTALAKKNDYFTFEVSVSPVRANQDTRVRLVYYQPIDIDSNIGRYVYPIEEGGTDDANISFWSTDNSVEEEFSFDLELKSAFPVKEVRLPNNMQNASITGQNNSEETEDKVSESSGNQYNYAVHIGSNQQYKLEKDIVFYYRLADDVPARVELVPYRENKSTDGTLMAIITPAADLKRISEGTDWVFILDKSGSMSGEKIQTLAKGMKNAIGQLNNNDRFRIITFSTNASDLTSGYKQATKENIDNALSTISSIKAEGGTNLYVALKTGYNKLDDDRTTNVVLVTDGVANTGETEHKAFVKLLSQYDLRLFTFIIGNSANQPLMERLAEVSGGFAMNISSNDDIAGRIMQAKTKALYENMHDVKLAFEGEKVYDLTPQRPLSLYQGQQLVVFGKYKGSGKVELELTAKISGEDKSWKCYANLPEVDTDNPELERMWALSHIENYMQDIRDFGENETLVGKIVSLGEEYSLVTDYTSMVVLNEQEYENQGIQRKNAERVNKERTAQETKKNQPTQNYRVDNNTNNGNNGNGAFDNRRSPGFGIGGGGGPVGPIMLGMLYWTRRIKNKSNKKCG